MPLLERCSRFLLVFCGVRCCCCCCWRWLDMRKALSRDPGKKSMIPIPKRVHPAEHDVGWENCCVKLIVKHNSKQGSHSWSHESWFMTRNILWNFLHVGFICVFLCGWKMSVPEGYRLRVYQEKDNDIVHSFWWDFWFFDAHCPYPVCVTVSRLAGFVEMLPLFRDEVLLSVRVLSGTSALLFPGLSLVRPMCCALTRMGSAL
jgi:hypothetical protein